MTVDKIELHDALLKNMSIDYTAKTVEIAFEFYACADDASRKPVIIVFEGVKSISQISDFDELKRYASVGGNVNYWRPGQNGATTFIYLSSGCLAIKAKRIHTKN